LWCGRGHECRKKQTRHFVKATKYKNVINSSLEVLWRRRENEKEKGEKKKTVSRKKVTLNSVKCDCDL
jgi:hypothetical protein